MNKIKITFILSGLTVIFAIFSLYNNVISDNEHDNKTSDISSKTNVMDKIIQQPIKSESDPEVEELSSKMMLLMHWKFISDTSNNLSEISYAIQTKQFDVAQEKLSDFSVEYDRHESNLQKLDILEKYEPVRDKMISYVKLVKSGLEKTSIAIQNDDLELMSEATNSLINAKNIENEINNMIKIW